MKLEKLEVKSFLTQLSKDKRAAVVGGLAAQQEIDARHSSCIPPDCPCL
ncbi:MAG: pinensin family lanthipeptide [Acidobacteriota bacterium]|nr:pinensin family lanthipeptide [Acidobacteriota bacterium]